jgi:epoxide hydrolase 4
MNWRVLAGLVVATMAWASDVESRVTHGYADSGGVKIHYAALGPKEAPLVVMIHGFPDFWYTWRHQMDGLADRYRVVAMDQRGYNLSGRPEGVEQYDIELLTGDVAAVIRHAGADRAVIVGHDWGGAVAWSFAMRYPEMTDRLVILNLPHPNGMAREMANNPVQRASSAYAQRFRTGSPDDPDILFGGPMTAERLAGWVQDDTARARYVDAFRRSDFAAMLNYYKRNYPALDGPVTTEAVPLPPVRSSVLVFHGLDDTALLADALNGTWNWVDADLTLVTVPGAGHFVQHDAAGLVTSTLRWWLLARE